MVKLLLIGAKKKGTSTKMLLEEAEKKFKTEYIPVHDIVVQISDKKTAITYKGKDITKFDYCLPRIDSIRARHGYHVIRFMDMLGMKKPYSADTILMAHNKFSTLEALKRADVPIPNTYLIDSPSTAEKVIKKMKYPIIVKLVSSFGGKGVMTFDNASAAKSAIKTMRALKQEIIIEEFIPNPGEDIRAFVVGNEVVASMKRVAKKGERRANLMMGGKAKRVRLTDEMEDIALRAAAASDSDIVAVDIIEGKKGPKVIEVNINPGIKGIQKVSNKNISKAIINFIEEEVSD